MKFVIFTKKLSEKIKQDEVFSLSAQATYFLLLSFFPFLSLILSLVSIFSAYNQNILYKVIEILPNKAGAIILDNVQIFYNLGNKSVLSFSFISSLFFASGGIKVFMKAFNKAYNKKDCRGFFKTNFIAIIFVIIIAIILILFPIDFLFLETNFSQNIVFIITKALIKISIIFLALLLLYSFLPCNKPKIKSNLIGSFFASIVWFLAFKIFSNVSLDLWQYNKIYGSIGSFLIFLYWLNISSTIIIIGCEINALLNNKIN